MKLVIAEKPSVGAAIAAVLGANEKRRGYFEGGGYLVSWCIGHLISLADAATYNEQYRKWKYDDLPIVPQDWQFTVANGKEQQFSVLKDLMHRSDVSEIVNACDSGREGELIFRFVYEQANCKKPFSRLWISSMEESAIREGFSNLKDGRSYDNLYQSALCRAKADWLVGINATRLFSILYHKTLNVGRVQTPTLTMLVNRDYAISSFKKEKYHVVRLDAGGVSALSERLNDEAAAQQMKAACEKSQAVCTSLKKEKKTVAPPKLFDLTALQREANRLYGFTAKQTLDYAQALYEKRLLTYPRTDSKYITSDMQDSTKELITGLCSLLPFMRDVKLQADLTRVCDNSKVTDHHAILPTAEFLKTGFSSSLIIFGSARRGSLHTCRLCRQAAQLRQRSFPSWSSTYL
jgi:DNA topoisomerase III